MSIYYELTVVTGQRDNAGTDSGIFIQLHGEKGVSNEVRLNNYGQQKDSFETGQKDKFIIKVEEHVFDDCGDIYGISLFSDMTKSSASWNLASITVERKVANNKTGKKTNFKYNDWISNQEKIFIIAEDENPTFYTSTQKISFVYKPFALPHSTQYENKTLNTKEILEETRTKSIYTLTTAVKTELSLKNTGGGELSAPIEGLEAKVHTSLERMFSGSLGRERYQEHEETQRKKEITHSSIEDNWKFNVSDHQRYFKRIGFKTIETTYIKINEMIMLRDQVVTGFENGGLVEISEQEFKELTS